MFAKLKNLRLIFSKDSFRLRARTLDARFNLPRPALEQHLTAPAALYRLLQYAAKTLLSLACAGGALVLGLLALNRAPLPPDLWFAGAFVLAVLVIICVSADLHDVEFAYSPRARQETYGSAFWGKPSDLNGFLFDSLDAALPLAVPLARFGHRHWFALPFEVARSGVAFIAKPGSGKTATFVISIVRAWSKMTGGVFCLDVKGEIFAATARYFPNVHRIDFARPDFSDAVDLVGICASDIAVAQQISALICRGQKSEGDNRFFSDAAAQLIKCGLLVLPYLPDQFPNPTVSDLYSLLAGNDAAGRKTDFNALFLERGAKPDSVHRLLSDSWGAYRDLDPKTAASIQITALTMLNEFRTPEVERVFSLPTPGEIAAGRRVVDFADLRRPGVAVFVVVSVQQAERLPNVLGVLFGLAEETLIRTDGGLAACIYDEAGNVKLPGPSEFVGICRGRNIAPFFFFQNKEQVAKYYGRDYANSFWESVATKVFLPGLEGESAKYCSDLCGQTTVVETRLTDAPGLRHDSRQQRQVGRALIDPAEVRQMPPFQQCVVVSKSLPPVRAAFPPRGDDVDPRKSAPERRTPLSLAEIVADMRAGLGAPPDAPSPAQTPADPAPDSLPAADETEFQAKLLQEMNRIGAPNQSLMENDDLSVFGDRHES
jgi:type IV secretory pathway TraG/TraD family ATPase VirD4